MDNKHSQEQLAEQSLLSITTRMGEVNKQEYVQQHADILFKDITIAGMPFSALFDQCRKRAYTKVAPGKFYNRRLRALNIARYFEYSKNHTLGGHSIECGVMNGFSSLILCEVARKIDPTFKGDTYHVCDSFEGLSEFSEKDTIYAMSKDKGISSGVYNGNFIGPYEVVREHLSEFPEITYHKGWIPEVLSSLPDVPWSFVHIDVDLYEPTLGCLEYFYTRLVPGGVIICDDYITPYFPGARKAWDEFFSDYEEDFMILDSGQSVYIRN